MNKISLGIVTVCSALAGMMLGKFLWLPQEVSVGTWFAMGINVVAVLISLSNIVNHGIEGALTMRAPDLSKAAENSQPSTDQSVAGEPA